MKYGRIFKTALLLSLFLVLASQVTAFGATGVDELTMYVRPEYDKAQTVFIWGRGKLSGSSEQKVAFTIPKTVDDSTIHICQLDESGETVKCFLREKDAVAGGFAISAQVTPDFKTEYYYPLTINGSKKSTSWTYKTDFDVKKLTISLAEPTGAGNIKVNPKAQSTSTDDQNFKLHNYTFSNVKAGQALKFDVSYTRSSNDASLDFQGGQQQSGGSSGVGDTNGLTIIAIVIGSVLVAGVGLFAFSKMSGTGNARSSRRPTPVAPKGKARFCTNCGSRINSGKFCPNCGSAVK